MQADLLSRENMLELLRNLIRIPSINPSLGTNGDTGEAAIAEFAHTWLIERGVNAWLEEAAPGRPNAVARVGSDGGRTLVFCAHIDTVSPSRMSIPPFEPKVEGNRVYGRGSYDMKGGVAAAMVAAAVLQADDLQGSVMLALVVDEEHSSLGADDFVRRHTADACIITEPTEGRLILTHKGFVWAELVAVGTAAHGSRWDLGVSAVGKMGRVISAMERFDRAVLRKRTHPDVGPASLHCSIIEGGVGISTYAPDCRMQVERRTLPGDTLEQVADELDHVVDESGAEASVNCYFHRAPLVCDPEEPVARCVRDAAAEITGSMPEETGVAYWTDAAIFAAAGVPSLNYGPGGEGAHGAVEWVDIDSVVSCARVLTDAARRFCRLSDP